MELFTKALEYARIKIEKFDPTKQKSVKTNLGPAMTLDKFCEKLNSCLLDEADTYSSIIKKMRKSGEAMELIEEYAKENEVYQNGKSKISIELPPGMEQLTLNMNLSAKGKDDKFFVTRPDENISPITGDAYISIMQLSPLEATANARKVIPDYRPRSKPGAFIATIDGQEEQVFNVYRQPSWKGHPDWDKLPDKFPPLYEKLVNHLTNGNQAEKDYLLTWTAVSLFKRAPTFLVLCGAPGTGKNRLKLVMRALHGHRNSVDGKRSTFTERFNSQLSENTLAWFDELSYDHEMENVMKELQNDTISIERKGVDATRATQVHSSVVISNNKPRDNFIAFDARKFAPLVINNKRLETSMTGEEIEELNRKVEKADAKTFDPRFLAQIAKHLKSKYLPMAKKFPNMEYRGPMFWALAHTSMTRWQKKAVMMMLEHRPRLERNGWDEKKKMFLWSVLAEESYRHNGDRSLQFPDFTTCKVFFDVFKDAKGQKAFHTEAVPGNLLGDFWIKKLLQENVKVMTEGDVLNGKKKVKVTEAKESDKELL